MPYLSADAHALLAQLVLEVRRPADQLEADRQGTARGADAALVAAVFAVAREREFSSAELIDMSHRPGVPEAVLRVMLANRSPKAAGKLLAPAAGKPCADTGLVLVRRPGGRLGATWRDSNPRIAARP